jgi:hypothetical protein
MDVLYVVERNTDAFESARTAVDIMCAGDSLTGWNNFGPVGQWPYQTYPDFLQVLCLSLGLRIANGGIAGEISDNGGKWIAPWRLADDYHVYGLGWNAEEIKYFVDGVVVQTVENTHWHQPLSLIFDSETMPDWFGMPEDEDLPSTFSIEYVRAWKKQ